MSTPLPPYSVVASIPELAVEFAERVAVLAAEAIAQRGIFTMAIPGGSVASAFLPRLALAPLPWHSVHLFWVDERAVAVTADASNAGLARRITEGTPMARASWHVVAASPAVLARAASAYARELVSVAGEPPVLDVVLLGVGEDGHVASIFGEEQRGATEEIVQAVYDAPKVPPHRVTLSVATLCAARQLIVAAFGSAKRRAIAEALENPRCETALAQVLREAPPPRSLLMLDKEAAGQ
jgi:6-phosphogluconolactonase